MEIKIGDHIFLDRKTMMELLAIGIVKNYDFSPAMREQHEKDAVFLNGRKIKATQEEIKQFWIERLKGTTKLERPLRKGEKVINLWLRKNQQR